ncbi:hypothetical protein E4U09_004276 [Claviceps aff. purpurea]|uniref:Uncharacterized protein n=1 Tax=Claviceps aff. purpurea TaxID=1967640 RepID=A0A9P7U4N3_9HYPO|nr:hypothetical protein E4U09_004276 [Claviceps aff. purpurea]
MGGPGTTTAVPDEQIQCVPIGGNTLDGDQWLADCRQAGTVDGYYRYKKDDTLDLSVTLWVWKASKFIHVRRLARLLFCPKI